MTQEKINETLRQVNLADHKHINCIRLNVSAGTEHNAEIIKRCYEYLQTGVPFITEAKFEKGRADILLPATGEIIEVLVSETDKRFNSKDYPFPVTAIRVAKQEFTKQTIGISPTMIERETKISIDKKQDKYDLTIRRSNGLISISLTEFELGELKNVFNN